MFVVLDTSVVAAGLRSRNGASNALLRMVAAKGVTMLASPSLFLEYEEVLTRPEQRSAHGLSVSEVDEFLSELAALIKPVQIHFQWRPQLVDPADEMVLETAINGGAEAIITHNVRHFAPAGLRFRVKILRPSEAIRRLRS